MNASGFMIFERASVRFDHRFDFLVLVKYKIRTRCAQTERIKLCNNFYCHTVIAVLL